jgi:DNA-binding beta-propeller fold protein YncE
MSHRLPGRLALGLAALAAAAGVTGCGGTAPVAAPLPAAPEPAVSPPASGALPGQVLPLPGAPEGVAITDGGVVGVNVRGPGGLVLMSLAEPTQRQTVPLPGSARHLTLQGGSGPFLVPDEGTDQLIEVDADGTVAATVPTGRQPHDAIAVAGGRVFVADELANTVHLVAGSRVLSVVPAPLQPGGEAATDGGRRVAVVGVRARRIVEYTPDGTRLGAANCGSGPTHAVTGDGGVVWVADTLGGSLLGFRLGPHGPRQVATVPVGSRPYGLAYDPARRTVWVTLTGNDRVVGLGVRGARVESRRSYATVRQPNTVAVDPASGTVVVTGSTSAGALQLLHP